MCVCVCGGRGGAAHPEVYTYRLRVAVEHFILVFEIILLLFFFHYSTEPTFRCTHIISHRVVGSKECPPRPLVGSNACNMGICRIRPDCALERMETNTEH